MKKEFKAPIVETREFATEKVMAEIAILEQSTGQARNGVVLTDNDPVTGYNQWKGFSN